nr:arrestin domain-containing protein 2-like [Lytechinus pictus]
MGVIKGFSILFANGKNVFTAKEHVAGEVLITLAEPMKVKTVEVTLRGHAKATKSGNLLKPGEQDKTKLGQVVNEYLNTKLNLTAGSSTLPTGQSRLPFSFLLPEGLPTSFESKHARIRYWLEASIIRASWFKSKRRTLQGFTIIEHVDVNQPELLAPVQESREHTIGCLCRKSFQATVTLNRKGYCAGESVQINLELVNGTKKSLQSQTTFLQKIEYRVKGRTHTDSQQINALDLGMVQRTQRHFSGNYYIQVPSIAPSINSCKIITVGYVLQFTVSIPGTKEKVIFDCPVAVGTIPFRQGPPINHYPSPPHQPSPGPGPGIDVGGFCVDMPPLIDWPSREFGPPLDLAPNSYPSCAPPQYPGGPLNEESSLPSAPPLPQYESGSGMFTARDRTALTPLRNAPELPEFHKSASEGRINTAFLQTGFDVGGNHPRAPPVAPKPASPRTSRSSPSTPNGNPLVLPGDPTAVRLKPNRPAPKMSKGKKQGSSPSPELPPPKVSPGRHIFQEGGEDCAHAYAECIFSSSDQEDGGRGRGGGRGGGEGKVEEYDDDVEDQDPDTYTYVPIYAYSMPNLQVNGSS